jgi:chemotaxis signal transduction protein
MESGLQKLVAFRSGRQRYALPVAPVVQIVEMVAITPIPQVNGSVEGVINYHGQAVPAIASGYPGPGHAHYHRRGWRKASRTARR